MYTFLNSNNFIYNLQFGFRQQYSTSHALINITENIRRALDDENIGCGVLWHPSKIWSRTPSIFAIYKRSNEATKFWKVHHFADDTNLLMSE